MASTITGIKTGKPNDSAMPASVVRQIQRGYPKQEALSMGPKPRSTVRVK